MSKKVGIIVAFVAVLGVIGIGAFMQSKKPEVAQNGQQVVEQPQKSENLPQESMTKGSLRSLLSAGKNVNCEIKYPDQSMKGMTYVSGNKMRGDFILTGPDGKDIESHMVNDGTYIFMWTDTSKQGTKIKLDAVKPSATPSAALKTADLDKEVDLKCSPWSVDEVKFNTPADVKFTDLSETMMNLQKSSGIPKPDKSICDQIEDPQSKADCLKSLNK